MSKLNQRFLSLLTVLVMLISMLPMSALAEGTYEVGTVVISDTMPEGDIPEGTYWQQTAVSAVYDYENLVCGEEHDHTDSCYAVLTEGYTSWTLMAASTGEAVEEAEEPKSAPRGNDKDGDGDVDYDDAKIVYDRTTTFNHIDIKVAGNLNIDGANISVRLGTPVKITHNGTTKTFNRSTSYEWRWTNIRVAKSDTITLEVPVTFTYEGVSYTEVFTQTFAGESDFVYGILNCDGFQGLDFSLSAQKILEVIKYDVTYSWTGLPAGLASVPAGATDLLIDTPYTVDTTFKPGDTIQDAANGKVYTFSGWTSRTSDGVTTTLDPTNPGSFNMPAADVLIQGVWTEGSMEKKAGQIIITKQIVGLPEGEYPTGLAFTVSGGEADVLVSLSQGTWSGSTWTATVPVGEGTYTVTETGAAYPGYSCSVSPAAGSVTFADITLPYDTNGDGEVVTVGTAAFVNTYTMKTGAAHQYPTLTVTKTDSVTGETISGAVFTMGGVENSGVNGVYTFANLGSGAVGAAVGDVVATYTLTESAPPTGYVGGYSATVNVVLAAISDPIYDGTTDSFITYYTYAVAMTDSGFNAATSALTVPNDPIQGTLKIVKSFSGVTVPEGMAVTFTVTGTNGVSKTVTMDASTNWEATVTGLTPGSYTVTEQEPFIHGYTWTAVDPYTFTVGTDVAAPEFTWNVTNTYTEWQTAGFQVYKTDKTTGAPLAGVGFTLYLGETVVATATTDANGIASFSGLTAGKEGTTYTLKETQSLSNYYPITTSWDVVVTAGTNSNYALSIRDANFSNGILNVANEEILGSLTITKALGDNGTIQNDLTEFPTVTIRVTGPDGYSQDVLLSKEKKSDTLTGLHFGTYTIEEIIGDVPGYDRYVSYSASSVTVNSDAAQSVTVTNTYDERIEEVDVPAYLTVQKLDAETNLPLAGVGFTLTGTDGSVTLTTGADGKATFGPFTEAATYTLTESTPLPDYIGNTASWTVRVTLKDGDPTITLKSDTNVFEYVYNWLVGVDDGQVYSTGILTVTNTQRRGQLTISKVFGDYGTIKNDLPAADQPEVEVTVTGPNSFSQVVKLNSANNWTVTLQNLKLGQYTVEETKAGVAGYDLYTQNGSSTVNVTYQNENTPAQVTITNTYDLRTADLVITKALSGEDMLRADLPSITVNVTGTNFNQDVVLNKANDWTVTLADLPLGSYTVTETIAAAPGYKLVSTTYTNDGVAVLDTKDATVTMTVTNTYEKKIQDVHNTASVTIYKTCSETGAKLAGATFTLYLNGEAVDSQTTDANGVATFTGLQGSNTYTIRETAAPENYQVSDETWTVVVTLKDGDPTLELKGDLFEQIFNWVIGGSDAVTGELALEISNEPSTSKLTVQKAWEDEGYYARPESVVVTLLRDGVAYGDSVTLTEDDNWSYSWEGLSDLHEWTIREEAVPTDYTVDYSDNVDGVITITNVREGRLINVTAYKVWKIDEGSDAKKTETVGVVLYRNGEPYDTYYLSEANNWQHTWYELNDNYQWTVDELAVPKGFAKVVHCENNIWTITNFTNPIPQTGDPGVLAALGTMGISAAGLAVLLLKKKKEQKD